MLTCCLELNTLVLERDGSAVKGVHYYLRRTPAPMLVTPAPGDLAPSSGLHGYLHTYICAQPHTYTKFKKIKPIAALGRQRPADLLVGSPA